MKSFVVRRSSGLLLRSVSGRAVHSTPPTGANQAAQKQESVEAARSPAASATTTSVPAGSGKVPDFIINHVSPVHSGTQWLASKRASDSSEYGDNSLVGGYKQFRDDIKNVVPDSRVFTDPLRTLAYGTDASFYRLVPKIVVKVHDEVEMVKLIRMAAKNRTPITFRAGGTSLSGQVMSASVFVLSFPIATWHDAPTVLKTAVDSESSNWVDRPGAVEVAWVTTSVVSTNWGARAFCFCCCALCFVRSAKYSKMGFLCGGTVGLRAKKG